MQKFSSTLVLFAIGAVLALAAPPNTPTITSPSLGASNVNPADVHMETGAFSDPDGHTHECTDWEIWTVSPTQQVWLLSCTTTVKTHAHLPDGSFTNSHAGRTALFFDTDYFLRVRFRDSNHEWSDYAVRSFRTAAQSQVLPMILQDVASSPTPTWRNAASQNVTNSLRLESPTGELFLEFPGPVNPPALSADREVRVRIEASVILPETTVSFTDGYGIDRNIYLPAMNVVSNAYFYVSANGSTYYDNFATLARGAPVPWAVKQAGYQVEVVATGFQLPVSIAFVPNPGNETNSPLYYVAELYGNVKVVTRDGTVSDFATNLLNFNPTGVFPGSGERGIGGICVDPSNGDVLVTMVYDAGGSVFYPKVVRLHSGGGQTTVLDMAGETQGVFHQISNVHFGPDGKLYVHVGDGNEPATALNLDSFRGKILRMNPDGSPATDNPFYDAGNGINARDYVFAYGVRNAWGGTWRDTDNLLYIVDNGPNVDRVAQVVAGRNFGWNGTDASMTNHAIYNWPAGPTAPVYVVFTQPNGFPASKMGHAFVTESGPTYATGPQAIGKRISEFVFDAAGNLASGPTSLIEYNGSGKATCVALAAGPDGLYFSDFYVDASNVPTDRGSNILRIKFTGSADFRSSLSSGRAPLSVEFYDKSNVPGPTAWLWDFGDGNTSTNRNPTHTYTADGTYNVRLEVTGANGASVVQKNGHVVLSNVTSEGGGLVVLEAEQFSTNIAGNTHSWVPTNAPSGFSGTGLMRAMPDIGSNINVNITTTSPQLQFPVNLNHAGTRYVWLRGFATDGTDDSVHVGVNGTIGGAGSMTFQDRYNSWVWTNGLQGSANRATITGNAGANTVQLWMREDGMRMDRVLLTTNINFKAQTGNAWHIPNNPEPGIPSMRNPFNVTAGVPVTIYNGNQFQGTGNPGNQLQSGSAIFFKRATDALWSTAPLLFHSESGNNKYFAATIPADAFRGGDIVQYYLRIRYDTHLPTFLYGNNFATEIESVAQANPYTFSVQPALQPTGEFLEVGEGRIYLDTGHVALGTNVTIAPPVVKIAGNPRAIGGVISSSNIVGGVQVRQTFGATSIVARLTFPYEGVMRYEVIDWGGPAPSETSVTAASPATERFYGFGEKFNEFDQSGKKTKILSDDPFGNKGDKSYKVAPWFVSTRGYGFHLDSSAESYFDMRAQYADRYVITNLFSTLAYNVVAGPKLSDVITRYTGYTGRPTLPPAWAFAPWMSSDHWRDGGEVRYVLTKYRERGIPGTAFVFDSPWEIAYNDFTWNMTQFGNGGTYEGEFYPGFTSLTDMMTFLRTNGWKVICWMTPFVNTSSHNEGVPGQNLGQAANYAEGAASNYFVRASPGGPPLLTSWWKGTGSPVDFTNPDARQWLVNQLSNLVNVSKSDGHEVIGGFKTDDGEGNYIPTTAVYFDGRTGIEMRNAYAVEYHKSVWNVLGTNGVLFARSGFTGSQAYPGYWAGDNEPNFGQDNGLQSAVVAGQSAAMSGYSIWSHDIGAYQNSNLSSTPTNLFMRWTQFGAFSPLMQMHRQTGNAIASHYPWGYGAEALANYRYYAKLHTALFPYIYSYAVESTTNGLPILRPLVLLHQDDPNVFGIQHTYYFGNEMIVAPVVTNVATTRTVYLPTGTWHDFFTNRVFTGGQNIIWTNANQSQMPVFLREGAIIPMISTNVMTLDLLPEN